MTPSTLVVAANVPGSRAGIPRLIGAVTMFGFVLGARGAGAHGSTSEK
jgi:hypothetical protein